ncbi:unnamed protein product [Clonostachys rhizophaga]|uniref:Fungal N-terminal domain-containing protein n=1 Tax=Clonostachys rhizophaga TaxID=160324 RepID=A0A9N9YS58_9HYPO|nr:unnamed protein product [Clonostachys rhizophaga]
MDPFSALASAIAIAGLAEKIITKSVLVVHNFRHAPSELDSLTARVHLLQDLVRRVELRRQKLCLAKEIEVSVYNCFIEAEQILTEIIKQSEEYDKPSQGKDKRLRLKWAFKGSHQMSVWDVRLQGIANSLYGIFLLMLLVPGG